ncbi:hypothetical protein CALCODRAFT_524292 [Calocera cornea HHB12733]|uniref:Methyltransferase type 11 domain-containing protein n=1 Tax=Calocera cornea HHB12733 TaxID=1353952 RepID=A0A165F9P4_9BASI|nr:hypothetical protein CALCODRAFT_524292 [Calocera cornea HHB12733]
MSGNLSHSMRENYDTHGVEKYYNLVSASYRNPHFPGVQKCLHSWLDKWWLRESGPRVPDEPLSFWDLAAGSGEVTEAILNWYSLRRTKRQGTRAGESQSIQPADAASGQPSPPPLPIRKPFRRPGVVLDPSTPEPLIVASDPFTAPAYTARTSRHCTPLSFADVADGCMPSLVAGDEGRSGDVASGEAPDATMMPQIIDMVVSSFALHLCTPSELFALLYELSRKSTWLVVLAPHKKPEIKPGWGWVRWNITKWEEAEVRLRVWKSLNS